MTNACITKMEWAGRFFVSDFADFSTFDLRNVLNKSGGEPEKVLRVNGFVQIKKNEEKTTTGDGG